jgi:hypothetical protein
VFRAYTIGNVGLVAIARAGIDRVANPHAAEPKRVLDEGAELVAMAKAKQLELDLQTHGGRRRGAGRKCTSARGTVPHVRRQTFKRRHPIEITIRLRDGLPCLRERATWAGIVKVVRSLREFAPDRYAFTKTLRAQLKQRGKSEGETITDDATDLNEAELREVIDQLTRQLDAMGPVNLDAVHEYDELEERHTFLETQNADLTNSRRELLDVIARINQTTEKLFAETFAQVRINFREMFAELFGGGRADLMLLDENDALNCGIDVIARPPGKQLQSVSLLSGGERTMTAVALLFAIYMVRPSPFCILDEMDAPLDESNINRFIRVLDRFVTQSQFVIITHNKRTIAKADILYGVTMEERGISRLVGMRLTEAQPEGERLPAKEQAPAQQQPLELDDATPENVALTR